MPKPLAKEVSRRIAMDKGLLWSVASTGGAFLQVSPQLQMTHHHHLLESTSLPPSALP